VSAEHDPTHQPTPASFAAYTAASEFPRPRGHGARDGVCGCLFGEREGEKDGKETGQWPCHELRGSVFDG
jgi:hypothetical protein